MNTWHCSIEHSVLCTTREIIYIIHTNQENIHKREERKKQMPFKKKKKMNEINVDS